MFLGSLWWLFLESIYLMEGYDCSGNDKMGGNGMWKDGIMFGFVFWCIGCDVEVFMYVWWNLWICFWKVVNDEIG